jgi:hypothetical protein
MPSHKSRVIFVAGVLAQWRSGGVVASARLSPPNAGVVAANFETAPLAQADVFAGWCGRTPRRPFSRVSSPWRTCHPPLRSRLPRCAMGCALEVRFALDSLVEGAGFELSVPRKRHNKFDVTRPHPGTESSYPTPKSWFPKVIPRGDNRRLCRKLGNPGRSIPYKQPTPSLVQEWSASVPESIASLSTRHHRPK